MIYSVRLAQLKNAARFRKFEKLARASWEKEEWRFLRLSALRLAKSYKP